MNTKSFQLLSRYSLPPNSLGYCGKDTAPERFKACISKGVCDHIEEEVRHFIVLNPYLKTLAEITKKSPFDYDVVEAYWIGNQELDKARASHYDILLDNLETQGVPDWLIDELRLNPPKVFIPNHLFQVTHVGVGRSSGSVPFNLDSINNCMIRWGKVIRIIDNTATVKLNSLKEKGKRYVLTELEETHEYSDLITPGIKIGDTVTVHWKLINNILNSDEIEKIEYWTEQVLENQK